MDNKTMIETGIPRVQPQDINVGGERGFQAGMKAYVEKRVLGSPFLKQDIGDSFSTLKPQDKANLLFEKLMAYSTTQQIIRGEKQANPNVEPEPVDPFLLTEIYTLWNNPETQNLFLARLTDTHTEARMANTSPIGSDMKRIIKDIAQTSKSYEKEERQLFLGLYKRPDQISAAKSRKEGFAGKLDDLVHAKQDIMQLKGKDATPEQTDVVATLMYDQLREYQRQAKEGFVWMPSRHEIQERIKTILESEKFPLLIGPPGTGKTSQVVAMAKELTGEAPVTVNCTSSSGVHDIIADKDLRRGESYRRYVGIGRAFTGYTDSEATVRECDHGRVAELNEVSQLDLDRSLAPIKNAASKRPGDILDEEAQRPVLPGATVVATSNEPITDERFDREFGHVPINYFTMTSKDPELYEFMLSRLLTPEGNIRASWTELTSAYTEAKVSKDLEDKRHVKGESHLIENSADPRHGTLYRLAFAIRALQDAYIHGSQYNEKHMANTAFYYKYSDDGRLEILNYVPDLKDPQALQGVSGDLMRLTAGSSTLTVKTISNWVQGYNSRFESKNPAYHTKNLTDWIKLKIEEHIAQASPEDAEKIRAIFNHFNLFNESAGLPDEMRRLTPLEPLTPKEIGYLSPRVPRPLHLTLPTKEGEPNTPPARPTMPEPYSDITVTLDTGEDISISPREPTPFKIGDQEIKVRPGKRFTLEGRKYIYAGIDSSGANIIARIDTGRSDEAIYHQFEYFEFVEKSEFQKGTETAEQLFNEDFLGEEAIHIFEEKCRAKGINVEFEIPQADFQYSDEDLEKAKQEASKGKARMVVLRPQYMRVNGAQQKINILNLRNLFKEGVAQRDGTIKTLYTNNPFGEGPVFYPYEWYNTGENFVKAALKPGYALPTKDVLPNSWNKKWADQNALFEPGERRREAEEAVWDILLYYAKTGNKLLTTKWDWTNSRASDGGRVGVGFDSGGLNVGRWDPDDPDDGLGPGSSR